MDLRLYKKPKYKIGDIVVFMYGGGKEDEGGMIHVYQGIIHDSYSLLESTDSTDTLFWYYRVRVSLEDDESEDDFGEEDILYKL